MSKNVLIVAVACAAFSVGLMSHKVGVLWNRSLPQSSTSSAAPSTKAQDGEAAAVTDQAIKNQLRAISTLGYVTGIGDATGPSGVTVHKPEFCDAGLNLVSSRCNNKDRTKVWPLARLMDMDGKTLHTWRFDAFAGPDTDDEVAWQSPRLYENGDLLVNSQSVGVVRLRADSSFIWRYPKECHSDMDVSLDGRIYVLSEIIRKRSFQSFQHAYEKGVHVGDTQIVVLSPDGEQLKQVSLLDAFINSDFDAFLFGSRRGRSVWVSDLFHTNRIQVLDGRLEEHLPAFKRNNVLVSIRNFNAIAVVDMDKEKVVWVLTGMATRQHYPTVLPNGNILIFDNFDSRQGGQQYSRVLEVDPVTQEKIWSFDGGPNNALFSGTKGMAQRLSNGNTLIVESNSGRVLEVTTDGDIVWEYYNTDRVVDDGGEHTTSFPHFLRYANDFPIGWAKSS